MARRRKFPECGSDSVARIEYGLPDMSDKFRQQLDEKEVVLGGCVVTGEERDRHCHSCGHQWRERPPETV